MPGLRAAHLCCFVLPKEHGVSSLLSFFHIESQACFFWTCHPQRPPREMVAITQLISIGNSKSRRESLIIINRQHSWRRQQSGKFCSSPAKPESRWLVGPQHGVRAGKTSPCLGAEPTLPRQPGGAGKPWETPGWIPQPGEVRTQGRERHCRCQGCGAPPCPRWEIIQAERI